MSSNENIPQTTPDIEAYQAMKLLDNDDYSGAIKKCHETINRFGPNRNCYLVKARAHLHQQEYRFAEESLQSVLNLDPEHPAAWAMLGEVYFKINNESKVDYCRSRLEHIFPVLAENLEQDEDEDEPLDDDENQLNHDEETGTESPVRNEPVAEQEKSPDETEIESKSIVPLEDLDKQIKKQNQDDNDSHITENDASEIIPAKDTKPGPEDDRQGGIKPEIFETATFADICFSQGKYEQAGKVYRKLLINEPDNIKFKDRLKIIESKIGLK